MKQILKGKKILITAGPTREYIDPVRYISNDSSGKMGYALTRAAKRMGGKVTLISGPTNLKIPEGIKFISVVTAEQMYEAAINEFPSANITICAAAVADFRPAERHDEKIKKSTVGKKHSIHLAKNPDILNFMGNSKKKYQTLIGFALETENINKSAKKKLNDKNCDIIIANTPKNIGSCRASIKLITKNKIIDIDETAKSTLASKILKEAIRKKGVCTFGDFD